MEEIEAGLAKCETFLDKLKFIRDTPGLTVCMDNNWHWLEYNGKEVEGTAGEWFTDSGDLFDLMKFAGIIK